MTLLPLVYYIFMRCHSTLHLVWTPDHIVAIVLLTLITTMYY